MKLDVEDGKVTVEAADLAPLMEMEQDELRARMQAGRIGIVSETGEGEDEGRFRVTFTDENWKIRLTCAEDGTVLKRFRARVGVR